MEMVSITSGIVHFYFPLFVHLNSIIYTPAEYRQFSLEKRAKLLPPPSDDRMEELKIGRETQTERELNSTQRCLK